MIPDSLGWFACGAFFSALLFGWPWHSRFSRYSGSSRHCIGKDDNSKPMQPGDMADWLLIPPPDVAAAINRQLDRDIAVELNRRRQQRLGGNSSPPLLSKPTKHELFQVLIQSGGATRCVSIEWLEPFAHAVLERWGR